MNNRTEFQKITSHIPLNGESIDWSFFLSSPLSPIFAQMSETYQNPKYHQELDVFSHTKMVCEEIIRQPEYINGTKADKTILFWSALLHDIGKITCTVERDGELKSPHHAARGALMARAMLWRDLGLCGSVENQQLREAICNLICYHSFPPYALNSENAELALLKIAANGELARDFSIEKLCALERADVLGRIGSNSNEALDKIECCKILAEDLNCYKGPYVFVSDFSKRAYFKEKNACFDYDIFNDSWGKIILLSGLPGTGKDTYIKERYSALPMISLDEIREEFNISPSGNQGRVISIAQERAREYLRKKQPFVWNATNVTTQRREIQISLFEKYGASVECVFLETEWKEQLDRNKNRASSVPETVIENMLSKLVLPERYECESVLWRIV